jgi:hypothetical protein
MLREDKRAHVEKQLKSRTPLYEARLPPQSTWERVSRRFTSPAVTGWKKTYVYELSSGKGTRARTYMQVVLSDEQFNQLSATQLLIPVLVTTWEGKRWWWYLNRFWWDSEGLEAADVQALILQRDKKKQATLERARADVFGAPEVAAVETPRRESIPESVRHEVWRRDQGRCVDCGSRERLEFDHIIPVSQGGSNTARNIELRCETCNRRKGAAI